MIITDEIVDRFEEEYDKLRDDLLSHKEGDHVEVYHRKLELANTMENARRVFLHFAETGKVEIAALDINK